MVSLHRASDVCDDEAGSALSPSACERSIDAWLLSDIVFLAAVSLRACLLGIGSVENNENKSFVR